MATEAEHDGWTSHEREQQRAWLALSPLERLRWLDGAKQFAQKYGRKALPAKPLRDLNQE